MESSVKVVVSNKVQLIYQEIVPVCSIMGLPDDSWHLKYYEQSYLFYILFTTCVIAFYVAVYCLKTPTRRFTNLREILETDPVINSYKFRSSVHQEGRRTFVHFGQTSVPEWNLPGNRQKPETEKEPAVESTKRKEQVSGNWGGF